jgi:hypothetical protein
MRNGRLKELNSAYLIKVDSNIERLRILTKGYTVGIVSFRLAGFIYACMFIYTCGENN